jgi:hypothetical protein
MNEALISACKNLINAGDLVGLKAYYKDMMEGSYEYNPNWEYIYHRVYLHACLKHQVAIADWLTGLFATFDPVSQIALRQIFPYGRHLLRTIKSRS